MRTGLLITAVLVTFAAGAQGVLNNGGKIVVATGAYLNITGSNGDFTNINSATAGTVDNNGTISLTGTWTNNASGNVFINANSSGLVLLNGNVQQYMGGSSQTAFENLQISNAAGAVLQQSQIVGTSLALTSGPLALNANTITVNNSPASAITRTSGYIVSEQTDHSAKIKWHISGNNGPHVFPFGATDGTYIPFTLDLKSGDIGYVTVSTYHTATNNTPLPVTPEAVTTMNNAAGVDQSANVVDRFWQVDKDGISGLAALTFTATGAEVGSIVSLVAQRWNSVTGGWDAPLPGQVATATSVTVSGVSEFSPWVLSGNNVQLPIELLDFTAAAQEDQVNLRWSTASETNNDYFTIERTLDGIHYETVTTVDGAGTSSQNLDYSVNDPAPYSGVSYYRLKQTDFDGQFSYAEMRAVRIDHESDLSFQVFPNPGDGLSVGITIRTEQEQDIQVEIIDAAGKKMYAEKISLAGQPAHQVIYPAERLAPGIYLVSLASSGKAQTRKLMVN